MPNILRQNCKLIFIFLWLIICSVSIVKLQSQQLSQQSLTKDTETYEKQEEYHKATVNLQKDLPSFGFNNVLANLSYLQFIQYFGDTEARKVTGYSLITDYFEVLVNRDPRFVSAYLSLSAANSLFAAQPEKTVELIDRVLEHSSPNLPGYPFFLWTYKATDEILFLGDIEAARNSYAMAAQWARLREDKLGIEMANRFHQTANFLAGNPDPTQAQFGAWMNVLGSSQDPKTQNYVLNQLKQLGAEITILPDGQLDIKPPKFNRA